MYQLKVGIPVKAVQFTGLNFMEVYSLIPTAVFFSGHPNEKTCVTYWEGRSLSSVTVHKDQWLVVDGAGPIVVTNEHFHERYERTPDAAD